jgi:hypothetical protein
MKKAILSIAAVSLLLPACSTSPWAQRQSTTSKVFEAGARYSSIAAAGAAGYYGGKGLGLDDGGAAAVGVGAGAAMYAFNKFSDKGKQQAYDAGIADGAAATRAEILKNNWTREAVYGIKSDGSAPSLPKTRRVYVPTRDVNGVLMQGGYQEVQYYP